MCIGVPYFTGATTETVLCAVQQTKITGNKEWNKESPTPVDNKNKRALKHVDGVVTLLQSFPFTEQEASSWVWLNLLELNLDESSPDLQQNKFLLFTMLNGSTRRSAVQSAVLQKVVATGSWLWFRAVYARTSLKRTMRGEETEFDQNNKSKRVTTQKPNETQKQSHRCISVFREFACWLIGDNNRPAAFVVRGK